MPNADTLGSLFRKTFKKTSLQKDNVFLIENFGSQSYFSAMKYAKIVIGNSSSGIIEAASFRKHVINIGARQKNRKCSKNVIHVPFKSEDIIRETENYINLEYGGTNIYQNSEGISSIVKKLKNLTL